MAVKQKIEYENIQNLNLDPRNPRLGREVHESELSQSEILEKMRTWSLEELAVSFLENGFWPQEALLTTKENLGKKNNSLVVVEGNRRLAALMYLQEAFNGNPANRKWKELVDGKDPGTLFSSIPYLLVESRKDVEAFLGFRHVTGIKEWHPAEKAEYISRMIDEGMSYREVMRKIGSQTPAVRQISPIGFYFKWKTKVIFLLSMLKRNSAFFIYHYELMASNPSLALIFSVNQQKLRCLSLKSISTI